MANNTSIGFATLPDLVLGRRGSHSRFPKKIIAINLKNPAPSPLPSPLFKKNHKKDEKSTILNYLTSPFPWLKYFVD